MLACWLLRSGLVLSGKTKLPRPCLVVLGFFEPGSHILRKQSVVCYGPGAGGTSWEVNGS